MDVSKIIKSTQEQASASWINYLNQVRLNRLMETLSKETVNLKDALGTIDGALETISKDIVHNGKGRGGAAGMHGFIAEVAECGIGNARSQIEGKLPQYVWINDNGPEDLIRGTQQIQQKFVQSGGHLSLNAVRQHLQTYPDFLKEGGVYQIPSDHYDKIVELLNISEEQAQKLSTSSGEFSMRQWREVHVFFESGDVPLESLEASQLGYKDVQRGTYEQTLAVEKEKLRSINKERKNKAYEKSRPSLKQGIQATAAAAVIEGGMSLCLGIVQKKKSGKNVKDFDETDWKDITGKSGKDFIKGGIRGVSIYQLTNFTATPAAVANALVTASFGVAEQAHLYRQGQLNEMEFIENSEDLCMDAAVSALSSFAGQIIIPIPVLGAVIGNAAGILLYQIAKDTLSEKEQEIVQKHFDSIRMLADDLQKQYQACVDELTADVLRFTSLLDDAFDPDVSAAFNGSVELARQLGVPSEEILDSEEKIYSYFMD